jgi:hypothetical protein
VLGSLPRPEPDALLRAAALAILALCAGAAAAHHAFGIEPAAVTAWLPPCPFRSLAGVPCPGCGIGRALLHLAQLRVGDALVLHPFAPLVAVGLVVVAVRPGWLERIPSAAAALALVALVGVWLVRLGAGAPI